MAAVICVAFTSVVVLGCTVEVHHRAGNEVRPIHRQREGRSSGRRTGWQKAFVIVGTGLPTPGFTVKLKLDSGLPTAWADGVNVNIEMLPEVEISPDGMVKSRGKLEFARRIRF